MDLEISPGDIDRIHGIGVPSNGKNRPIFNRFVRCGQKARIYQQKETEKKQQINYQNQKECIEEGKK